MLCRKGWKAIVVIVVVAGLLFRAEAELYSDFGAETPANAALDLTLQVPDFALINHHTAPLYLNSNSLPDLLTDFPAQDLFTYQSANRNNQSPAQGLEIPAWDTLWRQAHRIPINAVPEPSAFALLTAATLLLGARDLRRQK